MVGGRGAFFMEKYMIYMQSTVLNKISNFLRNSELVIKIKPLSEKFCIQTWQGKRNTKHLCSVSGKL
jgi:hypothetical protein